MGKFTPGICAFSLLCILGWSPVVQADAVTDWNANACKATACIDSLNASRLYAMLHIAIHDALNTINRRFQPLRPGHCLQPRSRAVRGFCSWRAVATAAHDVLVPVLNQNAGLRS